MMPYRKEMQMVFQDPYSSLNPRMTVEDIIGEPLDVHKLYRNRKERREKILDLMELVGLNAEHAMRYAHEFSGGQRQRIGDVSNVLFTNGWIADEDGTVFIYYASSDTRMHVATSTIDRLVDYCMNTPADGLFTSTSVETLKKQIDKNLKLMHTL